MLCIDINKRLYKKKKILFASESEIDISSDSCDLMHFFYSDYECSNRLKIENILYSAINDITISEDELKASFNKTVRYEINRAEKDDIEIEHMNSSEIIEKEYIKLLTESYYIFCQEKQNDSLKAYFNVEEFSKAVESGNVTVSFAKYQGGITYHIYYHDDHTSMLMFSFSNTLDETKIDKNLVGRANKYLHWKDILYFKEQGLTKYDWGGLFDPSGDNGIDKFKLSFGSIPRKAYDTIIGRSLKGKMLICAYIIKNKRNRRNYD